MNVKGNEQALHEQFQVLLGEVTLLEGFHEALLSLLLQPADEQLDVSARA